MLRWRDGRCEEADDAIAEEVPVALVYNGRTHAVMMATPCDLEDFALGFSLSEGLIGHPGELEASAVRQRLEGIELELRVPESRADAIFARDRGLSGRTGCGLCGVRALEDALRQPVPVADGIGIDAVAVQRALAGLHGRQPMNAASGATHAAAWASPDGGITLLREDVGRHNALDKLLGALARAGTDFGAGMVLVSSRASSEMVQKAATLGVTVLAAISAPTALAIQLAASAGLTLIGFVRSGSHVVYANRARVKNEGETR